MIADTMESENLAPRSINSLSEYPLINIFSYLDIESLKTATLVCKDWGDIIGSSTKLMKRILLRLPFTSYPRAYHCAQIIVKSKRKYRTMSFHFTICRDNEFKHVEPARIASIHVPLLAIARSHGDYLHELTIHNAIFESIIDFHGIIVRMQDLEKLTLKSVRVRKELSGDFAQLYCTEIFRVEMKRLKYFKMHSTNFECLRCMSAPALEYYETIGHDYFIPDRKSRKRKNPGENPPPAPPKPKERPREPPSIMYNFFVTLKSLKELFADAKAVNELFASIYLQDQNCFQFHLKKLKLKSSSGIYTVDVDAFLISQSSTLEELDMSQFRYTTYSVIFKELTHLKVLKIFALDIPLDIKFYENLKSLKNVKFLGLHYMRGETRGKKPIRELLLRCPNLDTLQLEMDNNYFSTMLPFISKHSLHVKHLQLENFPRCLQGNVRFRNLKSFTYCGTVDEEVRAMIIRFLNFHPSLKVFNDCYELDLDEELKTAFINHPNLEICRMNGETINIEDLRKNA